MKLVSEWQAIVFFGIIIVVSIVMTIVMKSYENYDKSNFHTFRLSYSLILSWP